MRKLYILLFISILFVGCNSSFEPEMCSITVESSEYYTYELEKAEAPLGSLVKISGTPIEHYEITGVGTYVYYEDEVTFFKDEDNENTFYFLVTEKEMNIHLMVKEVKKESVWCEKENCEVKFNNGDCHYIGDTVSFSVEPKRFYYIADDSLSIKYENDKEEIVEVTITKTSENNYSFIMPTDALSSSITLYCIPKVGFSMVGLKEKYLQNEEISFELKNVFEKETVDIYVNNCFGNSNDKVLLFSNVSSDSYTIDLSKIAIGKNKIYVYPYDNQHYRLISEEIQVDLLDTPEGWTSTGMSVEVDNVWNEYTFYLNNIETDCTSVMVSYYFENEETQINKKSFYLYSSSEKYFECNKSKFNNKTGKLVLWINDSYNKIVSPKITIDLE